VIIKRVLSCTYLGLILFPAAAIADSAAGLDGPSGEEKMMLDNSAGSLVWLIVALLIVIGLIVVFIKFLSSRNRAWGANRSLRSLGGVTLGQNKSLQVVEAAGRIYVVGVGEDVALIDKITDPDTVADVVASLEDQAARTWNPAAVADLWNKVRTRGGKTDPEAENWNDSSFEAMLSEKLNRQTDRRNRMESLLGESKTRDRLEEE